MGFNALELPVRSHPCPDLTQHTRLLPRGWGLEQTQEDNTITNMKWSCRVSPRILQAPGLLEFENIVTWGVSGALFCEPSCVPILRQ